MKNVLEQIEQLQGELQNLTAEYEVMLARLKELLEVEIMINDYARFVDTTTSKTSKNSMVLGDRINNLAGNTWSKGDERGEDMQVARLLTAVIGMMAESGEFAEVVKKKSISSRQQVLR